MIGCISAVSSAGSSGLLPFSVGASETQFGTFKQAQRVQQADAEQSKLGLG